MSIQVQRRILTAGATYFLAYLFVSGLDLWTTIVAVTQSGAHEGNAFVTHDQAYLFGRALVINIVGAAIMTGCVIFSAKYSERADSYWLSRPMSSFRFLYLNPWSSSAMRVSPLHMLSISIAFLLLRAAAVANNLLIYFYGFGPIGAPIHIIARHSSPLVGFAVVILPLFYLLAILVSSFAAKLLRNWRSEVSMAA